MRQKPTSQERSFRSAVFSSAFREDLKFWVAKDRKTALRLLRLVEETMREPFEGLGKPEALKGDLRGLWSRRITQEHRMVYEVTDESVLFIQGRYHYSKS